jgi:hypothetical protein
MRSSRVIRLWMLAAAQPVAWVVAAVTYSRHAAPQPASLVSAVTSAQDDPTRNEGVVRLFKFTLDFVGEISHSFERGDYTGAVIRLLIIVEVLIAVLGVVSCVTIWGKGKADLVYRIVDLMGALFLVIALLLVAVAAI